MVIAFKLPSIYNYHSSLSFTYIHHESTPEPWDPSESLFLFPVEGKAVAVMFKKGEAIMTADMDQEDAKRYICLKLNLDPSGVMAASDGLLVAKELGLLERHPHIHGFLPPRLGLPPKCLYTSLVKAIILQMVSYRVANVMLSRFVKAFGIPVLFWNVKIYAFPEPKVVYETPIEAIRKRAGLSASKARAIREVAKLELEGKLKELEGSVLEDPHTVARSS